MEIRKGIERPLSRVETSREGCPIAPMKTTARGLFSGPVRSAGSFRLSAESLIRRAGRSEHTSLPLITTRRFRSRADDRRRRPAHLAERRAGRRRSCDEHWTLNSAGAPGARGQRRLEYCDGVPCAPRLLRAWAVVFVRRSSARSAFGAAPYHGLVDHRSALRPARAA